MNFPKFPLNFPKFPLYQSLKYNQSDEFKELTQDEKDKFLEFIKDNDDEDKKDIVLALIRAYHLDNDNNHQQIAYGGKNLKGGIKFDFDCLPSKLQHMLYTFSNIK